MNAGESLKYLAEILGAPRFRWNTERDLQDGIAHVLRGHAFIVEREAHMTGRDRIDFIVHRPECKVGIEVKVDGSFAALARQAQRYALTGQIDALLVVTTRAEHTRLPEHFGGVPMRVLVIGGLQC